MVKNLFAQVLNRIRPARQDEPAAPDWQEPGVVGGAIRGTAPAEAGGNGASAKPVAPRGKAEDIVVRLFDRAVEMRASDVFFNCHENDVEVTVRHLGAIQTLARMPRELGFRCLQHIRAAAGLRFDERRHPQDGRWVYRLGTDAVIDLRLNTMPTIYGESIAVRLLVRNAQFGRLETLGLVGPQLPTLQRLLHSPGGILLITGPTGCGKTTTLYACLHNLNDGTRAIHTIEDPVEYAVRGLRQTQVDEINGAGFAEMVRAVIRQNPDVIMIGEIRDQATAETAVRAANSGQLVFATLHAPVAAAAVQSMLALGVPPYFLSSSLLAVIAQRLVRTLDPATRIAVDLSAAPNIFEEVRSWLAKDEGQVVYTAPGEHGYTSQSGVFELMTLTPALREMISECQPAGILARKSSEEGMIDFRRAGLIKVAQGLTSFEELQRVLPDADDWGGTTSTE